MSEERGDPEAEVRDSFIKLAERAVREGNPTKALAILCVSVSVQYQIRMERESHGADRVQA